MLVGLALYTSRMISITQRQDDGLTYVCPKRVIADLRILCGKYSLDAVGVKKSINQLTNV